MAEESNTEVFVYTEGVVVPHDVVRVRVHPSVTEIPEEAFFEQKKLEEVELCDGLLEIGRGAFHKCNSLKVISIPSTVTIIHRHAFSECRQLEEIELRDGLLEIGKMAFHDCALLKRINFPSTVKAIGGYAFAYNSIPAIHLPDSIESIGEYAFFQGAVTATLRMPLITTIMRSVSSCCCSILSVEVPESVRLIKGYVFCRDIYLRNVAISHDTEVKDDAFIHCDDLQHLFGSGTNIINALKHRFDNLPIHKMIYYQSYNNMTVDQLNNATNMRRGQKRSLRSKLDPTGKEQDCLGMTPLHILACSSVQNIQLYKVLVEKYPDTLITEDRWGAPPLLYAVWGRAPDDIIQFLVESYKSLYPNHEFNWTEMMVHFSIINFQDVIQKLLDMQLESFPDQSIDWDQVFDKLIANDFSNRNTTTSNETFKLLLKSSFSKRICAIGVKAWRNDMSSVIEGGASLSRRTWINDVKSKLASYEAQYNHLKEATTMIELVLWKKKINDSASIEQDAESRNSKKPRIDESDLREQSRVNCGADLIIENVLPYLAPRRS